MSKPLTAFAQRLTAVAGSALVLQFFSEFYFLNEGPAATAARGLAALPEIAELTAWYGLFAYLFLMILDRCEVRSLAGLLLAGSVFGWAVEGLVIPMVYEYPPLSFLWPSVSWHALIDVILGWFGLRLAMRRLAWGWLALLFAGLGMVWAFWASWTWAGAASAAFTAVEFRSIALVSGASWMVGTILADIGARAGFQTSRWELGGVGLTSLALFGITGVAFLPWSAALALVAALTCGVLIYARAGSRRDRLALLATPPPRGAYVAMPLLPISAGLTYPVVLEHGLAVPAEDVIALLMLLGALGFVWALVQVVRDGLAT